MTNYHQFVKKETNFFLDEAMKWLSRAQDIGPDGGVSLGYTLGKGWEKSYPETTGYVIPTFFDFSDYSGDIKYFNRAVKMADWELRIQMENGAVQGGTVDTTPKPIVFNTGQVIFGLLRAYKETKKEKYLYGAVKAGDWLASVQDNNGAWKKFTYNGIPHAYHTRVGWALAELYETCQEAKYLESAIKNANWALGNQKKNGWFMNNAFDKKSSPFTHTIAYAIRGLLELGLILDDKKIIDAATKSAERIMQRFEIDKFLYGTYNENWESNDKYTCLTGNAQLSIIWQRIYKCNGDAGFLNAALKINDFLEWCQFKGHSDLSGGIQGSYPLWGEYMSYAFPNWAVKFFVDALLLEVTTEEARGDL